MKRTLRLLSLFSLIALPVALTSCGSDDSAAEEAGNAAEEAAEEAEEAVEEAAEAVGG